jgi:hypothetical protein
MAKAVSGTTRRGFGETSRNDAWWVQPLAVFVGLSAFIIYSTWSAFQGDHYRAGPYLSPFYSPELFGDPATSWFGAKPSWYPSWLPFSPAFLILWAPAGFRLTCYYYRGAYYKAFWADPPGCAVGEPRKGYTGEHGLPLVLQNIHRYFLYFAVAILCVLWYDVWEALWFPGERGAKTFGIGLGTIVLALNTTLLTGYTLGCHSLRHLIGGRVDCLSRHRVKNACYGCVTGLNKRHMLWAWLSLFAVGFADVYVRLVSMGVWTDVRLI